MPYRKKGMIAKTSYELDQRRRKQTQTYTEMNLSDKTKWEGQRQMFETDLNRDFLSLHYAIHCTRRINDDDDGSYKASHKKIYNSAHFLVTLLK